MTDYTTHPDYRAMLAVIRADKADDLKRLVLADWLDEHGQTERAELIRVQCRIAEIRRNCMCGGCRTSGQHHNGPCGIDRERVELLDGTSRNAFLRIRNTRLTESLFASVLSPAALAGCSWDWDRGFMTVRGPLAGLIGVECGRCVAAGLNLTDGGLFACHGCRGTGRTVGVLPALVRDGVVERVEVTDREPLGDSRHEPLTWWRESRQHGTRIDPRSDLPDALFDSLLRVLGKDAWWGGDGWTNHDTREDAVSALSAALIAWAESEGEK